MDNKALVLDIAMNLNRVGNWAADDIVGKRKRINFFLTQTTEYIKSLDSSSFPTDFKRTFDKFIKEYDSIVKENSKDPLIWAEKLMTWGNILTHRSKLLK